MKRYKHLFEKVISLDNLYLADRKARQGKEASYGVQLHDKDRDAHLLALHDALLTKTFHTSQYDIFTIFEPKERIIYRLPYFPDRIVHHAIMNVLEPIWSRIYTYNTYSCIKGRGIEGCARQVEKNIRHFRKSEHLYCLKIDIKKFYPSIRHDVMKRIVRRSIADKDLLWLLDEIIDSASMNTDGTPRKGSSAMPDAHGLPIGNYISQSLANLVLCYFMHWCNTSLADEVRKALHLQAKPDIRVTEYADDIVFYSGNKAALHEVMHLIRKPIEADLLLTIKGNWQVFPVADNRFDCHGRALDYVGYKFFRHQKLIRKTTKHNYCKAVSLLEHREHVTFKLFKQTLSPWLGWLSHSNSRNLLKTTIKNHKFYENLLDTKAFRSGSSR